MTRLLAVVALGFGAPLAGAAPAEPLAGVIDLHCHSAPDVVARSVDDVQLARLARAAGMRAVVLKNHYTATADRAALAMSAVGGIEIFGGLVLNRAVGGLNAEAVRRLSETAGGRGKIVWLPTFDAQAAGSATGARRPFIPVIAAGRPVPELAEVLREVAHHRLVLATGHAAAADSRLVVAAARAAGIEHIVVTHALFPPLSAKPADLLALAKLGAWLEFSWLMHHAPAAPGRPMVPLAVCVDAIRAVGAEHIVLSSDFGQAANPPPPEGMRAFLAALRTAGITEAELDLMARRNPARILGLAP